MRTKLIALSLLLLGCFPSPPPGPPQAEVRKWHGDCKDYSVVISQPVATVRPDGLIGMADPNAKIARYQRPECAGGSWAVVSLAPTGRQELGMWLYTVTDLAPPFMLP